MGQHTKVSWCDTTWNPVMGCTPISEGCANCYARAMMQRYAGRQGWPESPDAVTLFRERIEQLLRWRRPGRVFVASMSDLFHEHVPFAFITQVFDAMSCCQDSTFYVLTKRTERIGQWRSWVRQNWPRDSAFGVASDWAGGWPSHIWLGVTAENQARADERLPLLVNELAGKLFVSVEPMLGPVDLSRWLPELGWVICGAESGLKRRPFDVEWARDLRDQCVAAGVPFFYKQGSALRPGSKSLLDGQEWKQVPRGGML